MTAQFPEVLILDGQKHALCTEPLARYLRSASIDRVFGPSNSACWRGYIGTWEVVENRLCLTAIEGNLKSGEIANLETIFPNATGPVFAHWFSGVLRIPQGEVLEYVHGGYESTYERDLLLKFEAGVLVSQEIKVNGIAKNVEADAPSPQRNVLGWLLRSLRSFFQATFRRSLH